MLGEATNFHPVGKIERGLGFFLRPVDPDPDFVQKLGSRLRIPKNVTLEGGSRVKSAVRWLLVAGLILGFMSILLLRRLR